MKLFIGLLLLGCSILVCTQNTQPPSQSSDPTINNNNVDDEDDSGAAKAGWNDFLAANRIPPWARTQDTPWGTRFFFKREADLKLDSKLDYTCLFNSTVSVLKCLGASPIECPAEAVLDTIRITTFTAFGVSMQPTAGDIKTPDTVKYSLYPRKLDKSGWKHSKIRDSAKRIHEYSLFLSPKFMDKGIRITDEKCWVKLISYLSSSKLDEKITLGTKPGRVDDVKIAAKIFIDKI